MVLELGCDLQFLRVGEGALEGGLADLAVHYWGCGWVVLLVRDFGCSGLVGCFGSCKGPVFEIVGGFLHEFGLDDGADSVQHGFQAPQLAGPETIGAPFLVDVEELSSGRDVLCKIGSIVQAEYEGGDEVHGNCMAYVQHIDGFFFAGSELQKR